MTLVFDLMPIAGISNDDDNLEYALAGVAEWQLLGTTLYSERKEYNGIAMTK